MCIHVCVGRVYTCVLGMCVYMCVHTRAHRVNEQEADG